MDAEGVTLDKILKACDALNSRMDAWDDKEKKADAARKDAFEKEEKEEKERDDKAKKDAEAAAKEESDPEKIAADKAKKDADEKEEKEKLERDDKAKKDAAARADAAVDIAARIKALEASLPKHMTDADYAVMSETQARADKVYQIFSQRATRYMDGETALAYRVRLLNPLKIHSPQWKDVELKDLPEKALAIAETQVYYDADQFGRHPKSAVEGTLREYVTTDETGRKITNFAGESKSWLNQFTGNRQRLVGIRNASN
jgi:chemotaxis protein histidine kinase CheA